MSNEQLMQEELKKAMGSVNEVATDELSDEELESVAGGVFGRCVPSATLPNTQNRIICVGFGKSSTTPPPPSSTDCY